MIGGMNKKGAIGLAMNTIVIVMISIVILTSGILLMKKFIGGAEDIKAQLDVKTEQELSRLLQDQGKRVAIPLNTKTIQAGESHVFGLGILNIDTTAYGTLFSVDIELSKVLDENDNEYTQSLGNNLGIIMSYILYDKGPFTLQQNEYETVPILVDIPNDAKKGTYIFNIKVTSDFTANQYDNTKKFYVTVT